MNVKRTCRKVAEVTWRFLRRLPGNLVWRWPRAAARGTWRGLRGCASGVRRAARWSWAAMRYYATLFLYTSRRFLRLEGYTALAVIVFYFATLSMSQTPRGGRSILSAYYSIFTVGMILLAMNLLPRESDEHTLEILWSQPFHRGALVLVQVASLTVWCGVVMGLILVLFARFLTAETFPLWVGIFGLTTAFAVALITVLISTFCRNAIATGIVAALIFGVHYFWLKELGPINLYFNPLPEPITRAFVPSGADKVPIFSALMNRFFLLVLLGFVYDYLLLRLRHSSAWLT